ncbi:MAG TPA: ATP-binding protein [Woeseiaceae bacterium]|nr:ATP-binding protein [Woeseiaceae bacterium]
MSLRSHLLLLTLVVLLPLALFGAGATLWVADRERVAFERGARQRTLALLTAVDTELDGHSETLRALASSYDLQTGDLPAFYRQAVRLLATKEDWRSIVLALPSGERVFDTALPLGTPLPILDRTGFDEAVRRNEPTIGNLTGNLTDGSGGGLPADESAYRFSVLMPVEAAGRRHILLALVDPRAVLTLLTPQRLSRDWIGTVLDSNNRIVARTFKHDSTVGKPASLSLQDAVDSAAEGWYRGTTLEGADTYASYNRSSTSGWTVALAIPAADVEALTSDIARLLAVGLAAATAIALILAAAYSQRISGPIMALASSAKALGWGAKVSPPLDAPVREVRDVSRALIASAHGFNEREEQLRAADQAKDEFLAMLGHELRNPLGALSSATQILNVAGADDQALRDAAAVVSRQVERMTRLVDDLLDVGRVISGKVRLQPAPLDLGRVVSQLTKSLQRASVLREHRVQLETVSVWIEGDETRIEQIVSNVLENAGKYTPRNGSISVRVFRDDDKAVFEVTDTGIGMPPDLLPRVFDLFAQGQRSIDRSASGLGIGLTLVKRLAKLHGGTVTAESDGMDKGARFTLRLPAIEVPARKQRRADDPLEVRDLRKVLLIEDNEDARRSMLTMLRHYGYRAFEAADGFEGVATADEVQPDAAIIDIGLPQYDGYEVAKRLRSRRSGGATILLIALTGYGSREAREKAEVAGFDEYLVKPVSPRELAELIESRLNARGRTETPVS